MRSETAKRTIELLDDYLSHTCQDYGEDDHKAMMMAVKALEQEPCEDVISRAQALSDYADWYGYGYKDNTFYKHLKDMPPVTPQPKIGHWIYDRARDWDGECKYECSECGRSSDVDYAYCMYCGAKMEASKDESTD